MVTIDARLVGADTPRRVQVTVEGLSVGDDYEVEGRVGSWTWLVRGGLGEATSSQVVLLDDGSPINTPLTYSVRVNGGLPVLSPDPVTVPFAHEYLIQSLSGDIAAGFIALGNRDPRQVQVVQHLSHVPGRRHPVVRFAPAGGESGQWEAFTEERETGLLLELLRRGEPVMLRLAAGVLDFPPTQTVMITNASRRLAGGVTGERVWTLEWVDIDDPLADQPVPGDTFADVDAAYEGDTFADLDAAYEGSTFGGWNRTDWAGMAAGA